MFDDDPSPPEPLPNGTKVHFDISQGLRTGEGIILERDYDEGWIYRLDVLHGDNVDGARNKKGELWAWDFEVTAST